MISQLSDIHNAKQKFLSAIGLIFSPLLFMVGVYTLIQTKDLTISTIGQIKNIEERVGYRTRKGEAVYYSYPVVEFYVDGHRYSFVSNYGEKESSHHISEKVTVLYMPENPNRAEIDLPLKRYKSILIPLILGAAGTAVSFNFFRRYRSKR